MTVVKYRRADGTKVERLCATPREIRTAQELARFHGATDLKVRPAPKGRKTSREGCSHRRAGRQRTAA